MGKKNKVIKHPKNDEPSENSPTGQLKIEMERINFLTYLIK